VEAKVINNPPRVLLGIVLGFVGGALISNFLGLGWGIGNLIGAIIGVVGMDWILGADNDNQA